MNSVPVSRRESNVLPFTVGQSGNNDLVYLNYGTAGTTAPASGCIRDTPQTAVRFNAASKNCTYADVYWGYTAANVISIGTWFRSPTPTTAAPANGSGPLIGFASERPTTTSLPGYQDRTIYIDNTGRIMFGVAPAGVISTVASSVGVDYRDGQWHHVVATLSSAGMKLYVDGALASRRAKPTIGWEYNGYWRIGCQRLTNWPTAANTTWTHSGYYTGDMQYAFGYYGTPL